MREVVSLEDQAHFIAHLDDLTVQQAELLVVIEDCIHVLDPLGVHWSIEDDPLARFCSSFTCTVAEHLAQHTVGELVRDGIEGAVKL